MKYNFENPNKPNNDYSQDGQSVYIDKLLIKRSDGFYIGKRNAVVFLIFFHHYKPTKATIIGNVYFRFKR